MRHADITLARGIFSRVRKRELFLGSLNSIILHDARFVLIEDIIGVFFLLICAPGGFVYNKDVRGILNLRRI